MSGQSDPDVLFPEAVSRAVAQAVIPFREEALTILRRQERHTEQIAGDVAEMKALLQSINATLKRARL